MRNPVIINKSSKTEHDNLYCCLICNKDIPINSPAVVGYKEDNQIGGGIYCFGCIKKLAKLILNRVK